VNRDPCQDRAIETGACHFRLGQAGAFEVKIRQVEMGQVCPLSTRPAGQEPLMGVQRRPDAGRVEGLAGLVGAQTQAFYLQVQNRPNVIVRAIRQRVLR
jgi:hypothetical protein